MPYVKPEEVCSPKDKVANIEVLYDTGSVVDSWSVARLEWKNKPSIAIRWNGESDSGIGSPQSRGLPTWFIVPDELRDVVESAAKALSLSEDERMRKGYVEMAANREREEEAEAWSEAMIGDTLASR